ncbi:MAG TPA: hypothetical protein VGC39_01710 [Candidatus Methylacidiphilales bacterium]
MASKFNWIYVAALLAQYPAACLAQRANPAAAVRPWIVVMKPGQTAAEAVREARRAMDFARYPVAEATALLHPTTEAAAGESGYPRITAGKILSTTLNVAVAPGLATTVEVSFNAPAGVFSVVATFTSPHGQSVVCAYYEPYVRPKHGSLTFQAPQTPGAGLYAEPCNWTLTNVEITDANYQMTTYSAKKLDKIFSATAINVINTGTPDFTPPTISAGDVLTRKVNLNDPQSVFKASLTAADDVSGVSTPIIVINMESKVPGGYEANQVAPLAELNGTFDIVIPGQVLGVLPGVWQVVAYGASDVAGNLFLEDSPAKVKALFGNVDFTVDYF